ncbi:MAG: DUF2256 domain-containing protein [Deltaproteobacteria bacterium]|nr:DUF2256 domain-containing protein [Deltaproteobacteria bacterium]
MPRGVRKEDLPPKACLTCGRPFTWRTRWARDWDPAKSCSALCRRRKRREVPS